MSLRVLFVDGRSHRSAQVTRALREHGHQVSLARGATQAQPDEPVVELCDVALIDLRLEHGSALELCRALRRSRPALRLIVLDPLPTLEACRAAMRAGADDYLDAHAADAEFLRAVEGRRDTPTAPLPARTSSGPRAACFERTLEGEAVSPAQVRELMRALVGFLAALGYAPSVRARAAGAAAELVANALEHGRRGTQRWCRVVARGEARRIEIEVDDLGPGLEGHSFQHALSHNTGGLARAAALVERCAVETDREHPGARVRLSLDARSANWSWDGASDWSECDYLEPEQAKQLLVDLQANPQAATPQFSPALCVAVGRLLAGVPERQRAEQGLWG